MTKKTKHKARKPSTAVAIRQPDLPPPANMMQVIARASADKRVDVPKMRELIALQERIEDRNAQIAFDEALTAAQAEIHPIVKDAKNASTSSMYARLETISRAIDPVAVRHGFSMSWGTGVSHLAGHYRVTCILARAGHRREYFADVPADNIGMKGNPTKTATHGMGSAMSYGRRYLKMMMFNAVIVGEDDDGITAGDIGMVPIDEKQFKQLNDKLENVGADKIKFCSMFGIDGVAKLPRKHFEAAMLLLKQREQVKGQAA